MCFKTIDLMMARKKKSKNKSISSWLVMIFIVLVSLAANRYLKDNGADSLEGIQRGKDVVVDDKVLNEKEDVAEDIELLRVGMTMTDDDVLLDRKSYVVCFNTDTRCPNYVAWRIDENRLRKNVKRSDNFMEDTQVADKHRIIHSDYSRSGYDRGHMCPAADNRHSQVAMDECFLMTNICPQTHTLNAGDWNDLEEKCREWGRIYDNVYVVSGPIYTSDKPKRIGQRKRFKIAVPDKFFKVVLLEKNGGYSALGYVMDNNDDKRSLADYAMTVDEVETMTKMDFFHALPDEMESKVEGDLLVLE